jgi:DnaK suppressor protein
MDNMHKDFLERLNIKKRELEDLITRLIQNQKEYQDQLVGEPGADESDNAQREISVFDKYSFIGRKNKELKKIEHLIQKIARNEDFGICEECGDPIPIERLLIVPESDMCVNCQSEMEESYRSRNSINSTSYYLRGKKASEWEETGDSDDSSGGLIDSELDIFSDVDMGETEIIKKRENFSEESHSNKGQTRTSGENRV